MCCAKDNLHPTHAVQGRSCSQKITLHAQAGRMPVQATFREQVDLRPHTAAASLLLTRRDSTHFLELALPPCTSNAGHFIRRARTGLLQHSAHLHSTSLSGSCRVPCRPPHTTETCSTLYRRKTCDATRASTVHHVRDCCVALIQDMCS